MTSHSVDQHTTTVDSWLKDQSDQTCIAFGVRVLHKHLGSMFAARLQSDACHLLDSGAALGDFPTRILLAHGLGWFDDATRYDLVAIHNIHERMNVESPRSPFSDPITGEWCGALKAAQAQLGSGHHDGLGLQDELVVEVQPITEHAARAARRRFELTVELVGRRLQIAPPLSERSPGADA